MSFGTPGNRQYCPLIIKSYSKVINTTTAITTNSFARSATCPSFAYMSNPARTALCAELLLPDCVHFSCCSPDCIRSPIASASAAAPQFSCCSPDFIRSPIVRFSCCSPIQPIASALRLRPLWVLLPDCTRFNCCSPIATAAPRLHPLQLLLPDCSPSCSSLLSNSQIFFIEFKVQQIEVRRSYITSLVPPHDQTSHFRHGQTHVKILIYRYL